MKKVYIYTATLLVAFGLVANANWEKLGGWNFFAPKVADKDAMTFAEDGDIVYDTSENKFYGKDNSGWKDLSSDSNSTTIESIDHNDSPYLVPTSKRTILVDTGTSSVELDLPAVSGNAGLEYVIKKTSSSNTITIDPNSTETIDGSSNSFELRGENESMTIVCDGTEWHIVDLSLFEILGNATQTNTTFTSTSQFKNLSGVSSFTLYPGTWLISMHAVGQEDTAASGHMQIALSQYSGNTTTDHSLSRNVASSGLVSSSANIVSMNIVNYEVTVTSNTTYYLKALTSSTNFFITAHSYKAVRIR